MQMYSDAPQCVRARLQVCLRMRPSTYLWILSRCKLTESFQYCLLAVFKCLLNTVFGRSAECNNGMWKMCDFIILLLTQSTNALLATCPWKFKFGKLAIVRICTMFALCVVLNLQNMIHKLFPCTIHSQPPLATDKYAVNAKNLIRI